MEERWYAVYTKPRWEKKVADILTLKEVENYCPLNRVIRQWSDRKKFIHVPLFTSYVFVHVKERHVLELNKINGIIQCVRWLGKPAVIRDEEIDTLKRFLNEHDNVQVEKMQVQIQDTVRITNGYLTDTEGTVVAVKNNIVKVNFASLGYTLFAEIDKRNVAKVHARKAGEQG